MNFLQSSGRVLQSARPVPDDPDAFVVVDEFLQFVCQFFAFFERNVKGLVALDLHPVDAEVQTVFVKYLTGIAFLPFSVKLYIHKGQAVTSISALASFAESIIDLHFASASSFLVKDT